MTPRRTVGECGLAWMISSLLQPLPGVVSLAGAAGPCRKPQIARFSPFRCTDLRGLRQTVDVVDLLPDFVDYTQTHDVPTSSFYLPSDAHWSSFGNAVAAEAVDQHLRGRRDRKPKRR